MIARILSIALICLLCFASCKSKKTSTRHKKKHKTERIVKSKRSINEKGTKAEEPKVVVIPVNTPYGERVANYINEYRGIAMESMKIYGIPASITLAQGILESGAGAGELTRKANNHFGIKCHTGWEGDRAYHDDDESQECFRKYDDPRLSFRDHSLFLTSRSRYADLFTLRKDDYKAWAKGLRKAGYATDPKYPDKLISIIERYGLDYYDSQTLSGKVDENNSQIDRYAVQPGDTLYSISKRFNLSVEDLKKYNNMEDNSLSIGQMLYLNSEKN